MGFRFTHPPENRESTYLHEAAYGELAGGSLIGAERILAEYRRAVVILYLILLLFLVSIGFKAVVGNQGIFLIVVGLFLIIQVIFAWLERNFTGYKSHRFRVIRFLYYLLSSSVIFFIGKGSDIFLLLFLPYLILAGVYVGTAWSVLGSFLSAILVLVVYRTLFLFDIEKYTAIQITTRVLAIFFRVYCRHTFGLGLFDTEIP